jgi:putative hydrolase of the HAD superfamily
LEEYLIGTVFFENRPFTQDQFRESMFAQSVEDLEMIQLIRTLKAKYGLKTIVVSNEVRELNAYRIQKFNLDGFVDAFVSSCFVGIRKPDPDIFRLALDVAHVPLEQIVYIENTPVFVDIAEAMSMNGIRHTDHESTRVKLEAFGLQNEKGASHTTGR